MAPMNGGPMRSRRGWLLVVVGILGLCLQGCDKFPYYFNVSNFPSIPANAEFEVTSALVALPTFVPAGTLQISGQVTPQSPSPIPSTLRIIVRYIEPNGTVDRTFTFDLAVHPDGTIPDQVFPTPNIPIDAGEETRIFFVPLGAALSGGQMKLKFLYEKT